MDKEVYRISLLMERIIVDNMSIDISSRKVISNAVISRNVFTDFEGDLQEAREIFTDYVDVIQENFGEENNE